ncbi:MAG: hypothetical protein ABI972_18905 [Acidobacteriota bacterium]
MTIDSASVNIKPASPGAKPAVFIGRKNATCNLTRGFIMAGDTETFNDAINFTASVKAATSPKEFSDWKFRFLQFQRIEFLGFFYAGPKKSAGQISMQCHLKPAMSATLHLDSEDDFTPWTHDSDASLRGNLITQISGDHPASRAALEMTNNLTNATNFLFHIVDKRTFWSVFTAQGPDGKFQPLGHVEWALEYNFMFKWRGGKAEMARDSSSLTPGTFISGAPTDSAVKAMCLAPAKPHSNESVRNAIRFSVTGGPPNRSDQDKVQFINLPADFFQS